ncbi:retrotransposon protein, putative, ty1-copia subclass [Tanacetum coccineum]
MAIQGGRIQKAKQSLNAKGKEVGHCKRNYHAYLAELNKKKKKQVGLRGVRKLKQGALYLCVGNGICAQVEAIGSDDLALPNVLFKDYLKAYGIVQHLTPSYTPQHNGVSERRNRTLLDMVRSIMNLTTLPLSFWDYALETATRILNMVPTKKADKKPYEFWYVEFLEKNLLSQEVSGRAEELEEIQDKDKSPSENTSEIPMEVKVEEHSLGDLNEPTNYKAAILDPESDKWVDAMNVEMQSMKDNQVWCLVDLPPNCKTIGSKWLFKKKTNMDGIVHTYKARLVAKGYTQTYGFDYEENVLDTVMTY